MTTQGSIITAVIAIIMGLLATNFLPKGKPLHRNVSNSQMATLTPGSPSMVPVRRFRNVKGRGY